MHAHQSWLRMAMIHSQNNPQTSAIATPITEATEKLNINISQTLETDFTDLLGDDAHTLLQHLREVFTDPSEIHPEHIPDHVTTPTTDDTHREGRNDTTEPHPPTLQGTHNTDTTVNRTNHTTNNPNPTNPTYNPPSHWKPPSPTPHTTPPNAQHQPYRYHHKGNRPTPPPPRHYSPTHTHLQSPKLLAQARLNTILQKPTLTQDDIAQMTALSNIITQTPAIDRLQEHHVLPNLLGWAGLTEHDIDYFHAHTHNFWEKFLHKSTTAGKLQQINQYLLPRIPDFYPDLVKSTHHTWQKTIATLDLAPQPIPPGTKAGLGPLAYVQRAWKEIHTLDYNRHLNASASHTTTADIEKTKLGDPILPDRLGELKDVLKRQSKALQLLFTHRCPLATEIDRVTRELEADMGGLAEQENFRWVITANILWQVSTETTRFFRHLTSDRDLRSNNVPKPDLAWLAADISRGTLKQAMNRPPAYSPPDPRPRRHNDKQTDKHDPTKRHNDKRHRQRENPEFTHGRPKLTNTVHSKTLPTASVEAIERFRQANPATGLPRLAFARAVLNIDGDQNFAKRLDLNIDDCIRYHFYGKCGAYMCRRRHVPTKAHPDHTHLLTKVLTAPNAARKSP